MTKAKGEKKCDNQAHICPGMPGLRVLFGDFVLERHRQF